MARRDTQKGLVYIQHEDYEGISLFFTGSCPNTLPGIPIDR